MARIYSFDRRDGHTNRPVERRRASGTHVVPVGERTSARCNTQGYTPRWERGPRGSGTNGMRNLSPSLRGCYADPIELALEEHGDLLPEVITDPGRFTTEHRYNNPRDPGAYPKHCAVTTVCQRGQLRTFVHLPGESLAVFES